MNAVKAIQTLANCECCVAFLCASVWSNANNEISRLTCWRWQVCNLLFAINFLSSSKNLLDPVWYVLIIMIIVALIQNCNLLLLWSILVVLRYLNWSVKFRLFAVFFLFIRMQCKLNLLFISILFPFGIRVSLVSHTWKWCLGQMMAWANGFYVLIIFFFPIFVCRHLRRRRWMVIADNFSKIHW